VNRERLPARLGVAAAAAVLALTAVPYAVTGPTSVSAYYGVGIASPVFVSLLAVVGAVTLLSGATGRSDPALAAGVAVTVSAFAVVLAIVWALPAREVALGIDLSGGADVWFGYHSPAVVVVTLVLAAASGLYARSVL
jgi:hypothetical protein